MATKHEKSEFERAEYERAYEAYGEHRAKGSTDLMCLRCGHGHFQFKEIGNSVEIRCDTPGCVVAGVRGI